MPPRKRTAKQNDKEKLKQTTSFTVTIAGTENNVQRIAAMLLFADFEAPELNYDDCAMPWEDPNDPRFTGPKVELDYNAIRKDIVGQLTRYMEQNGQEKAKAVIASFGAPTLRAIAEDQLLPLYHALKATLDGPGPDA